MKTKPLFIAWQIFLLVAVSLLTACSSSKEDSVDTIDIPVDKVKNPTKVSSYEGSATFKNDLDALVTYMLDQRAFRWSYLIMASNGNSETAPFSATLENIDGDVGKIASEFLYDILDHFIETSEAYEGAIERLSDYGIIDKENGSKTRGYKSDIFDFSLSCKKARSMGRKSVMAILRKGRWTTDTDKLNELYKTLPSNLTRGYSNATDFWSDFSAGKLDNRSNQVFVNLYNYDPMGFGATADDLGVTPARNIAIAGGDLISKGMNVALDACPFATQIGYGKDIYNSLNATSDLITKGDVKGFIQNMTNNLTSYGNDMIKIVNKMKKNDVIYWEAAENFWSEYGQDLANVFINDVAFSDEAKEAMDKGKGAHLIPNIVMTKDANGQEIALVLIYDEKTGQLTAGYVFDKDGNIIADPKLPGMKKITVVDRNGRRVTKTVTVSGDEPNPVIVDMEEGNVVLEDEPANGYLMLQPDKIYDEYGLSGTHEIRVRTNYLYYSSSTEEKWIATSTKTDISLVTIKLAANDTGEKRTGKVFVYGTNKDGKVLKKEVINVIQEPKPAKGDIVWTEPAAVAFDADGGKQNIVVGHFPGYSFIGCMEGSDLAGWCYLETAYSPAGEPTYTIKADPNTTGEERSGTVTFYASNSNSALENVLYNNAKPDGETVAETTVIIKQMAGEIVQGNYIVTSLVITPNCYVDGSGEPETLENRTIWNARIYAMRLDWVDEDCDIKVTNTNGGNSLHVEGRYNHTQTYTDSRTRAHTPGTQIDEYLFSFDIDNIAGGMEKSVINNLDVKMCIKWNENNGYNATYNTYYSASNIAYDYGGNNFYHFNSTVAKGLLFNKYEEQNSWSGGGSDSGSSEVNMVSNSENSISVIITLEQTSSTRNSSPHKGSDPL